MLGTTATGNRVAGNLIGTNPAGAANLGNALDGLVVNAAPGNTIGGHRRRRRNVISGNGGNGIDVLNIAGAGRHRHSRQLHRHRIHPASGRLGNGLDGVLLNGVSGTVIAGAALPNLISGNAGNGIHVLGPSGRDRHPGQPDRHGHLRARPAWATAGDGIALEDAGGRTIGGLAAGQGNLISGNGGNGIHVYGTASGNVLLGNTIGTDAHGDRGRCPTAAFGISIEGTTETRSSRPT